MKQLRLDMVIAWVLLSILGLLVLHAPLTVWLVSQGAPVEVKAWKEFLLVVAGVLLLWDVLRSGRYRQFLRDKLLWLVAAYGIIHAVVALVADNPLTSEIVGLMVNLRYVVFFALVYIFLSLYPTYRSSFIKIGVLGAVIVSSVALLQVVLPHDTLKHLGYSSATIKPYILLDDNPSFVRINSTLRGPNPLGAYAMIVLLGVAAYCMKKRRGILASSNKWLLSVIALGSAAALWLSYSRSAWIGLAAGAVVFAALTIGTSVSRRQLGVASVFIVVAALALYGVRDTTWFHAVILHDDPTTGAVVTSDQAHAQSITESTERFMNEPFGRGVGTSGSASLFGGEPLVIENQYLMVAHEVGWLGAALFVGIWLMVLHRLWLHRRSWLGVSMLSSGIGLMVIALVWPVLVDDPVSMMWWGLAAVAITPEVKKRKARRGSTTNKKAA